MRVSNSLIRRYTPPTCTLEIWAQRSPLSFWAERPLLKELKFALHFDDPRVPEEEQVTLEGDRPQLELLGDTVGDYVQGLLQQSSLALPLMLEPAIGTVAFLPEAGESSTSDRASALVPSPESSSQLAPIDLPERDIAPSLQPNGLLTHQLSFGSLTTKPARSQIQLSISQLFDLANALEEFNAEVDSLPVLDRAKKRKKILIWSSAAAATILAVGLTAVGGPLISSFIERNQSTALKPDEESQKSPVADVVPPVPPAPTGTPVPSPTQAPSLAAQKPLPPPPPVGSATAPRRPPSVPLVVPPSANLPAPPAAPPAPERQVIAIPPAPAAPTAPSDSQPVAPSTVPILPAPNGAIDSSDYLYRQPALSNLPNLSATQSESSADESAPTDRIAANSNTARSSSSPSASDSEATRDRLLDTIPQVAEVRAYFQQVWKVPPDFNQTLEYRLILNKDGSVKQVIPLGKAATVYLPYVAMPPANQAFVSPLNVDGNPTIRVVLGSDGTVKTFLEG